MAGDTARAANTDEVKGLRREARDLKEVFAEQTLELRLLKKSMFAPSHRLLCKHLPGKGYDRYMQRGEAGLKDQSPKPKHVCLDLSRNCAAPLTAYYALKENIHGKQTNSRI